MRNKRGREDGKCLVLARNVVIDILLSVKLATILE
jgi:hypothetical protein